MILNFVIFFDLITSMMILMFFSLSISLELFEKYSLPLGGFWKYILAVIIMAIIFSVSFFNLQKISWLSYIGISILLFAHLFFRKFLTSKFFYFQLKDSRFLKIKITFFELNNQFKKRLNLQLNLTQTLYIPIFLAKII